VTNPVTKEDVLEPGCPYQVKLVSGQTGMWDCWVLAVIVILLRELVEDAALKKRQEVKCPNMGLDFSTLSKIWKGWKLHTPPPLSTRGLAVTPLGLGPP
jgi:hypothetical protein